MADEPASNADRMSFWTLTSQYIVYFYEFRTRDSKLNWIPHITYVKNKIYEGIGIKLGITAFATDSHTNMLSTDQSSLRPRRDGSPVI